MPLFFTPTAKKDRTIKYSRGFTLIELLVVIGIMGIMTAVSLANYKLYSSDAALANAAHDLALTVRETQLYGISVKESTIGSGKFSNGYGLHFSSATANSYIAYQDIQADPGTPLTYTYDSTNPNELVSVNTLPDKFTIQKICTVIDTVERCINAGSGNNFIDLEFVRPNPDLIMSTNINVSQGNVYDTYDPKSVQSTYYGARIYLTSGTKTRTVYVDKTGQISVK